jgi:hypothetical protein
VLISARGHGSVGESRCLARGAGETRGLALGALGQEQKGKSGAGARALRTVSRRDRVLPWRLRSAAGPGGIGVRQAGGGASGASGASGALEERDWGIEQRNERSLLRIERLHHPYVKHWIIKQSRYTQRLLSFTSAVERQVFEPVAAEPASAAGNTRRTRIPRTAAPRRAPLLPPGGVCDSVSGVLVLSDDGQ